VLILPDAKDLQTTPAPGYENSGGPGKLDPSIDLALFYGRNNLLSNGDQGWVPGNVLGTYGRGPRRDGGGIPGHLDGWRSGETLTFNRLRED